MSTFLPFATTQFVTRNGQQLSLDGKSFSFAGANFWHIGMQTNDFADQVLQAAKSKRIAVLRVAAWNEKDVTHGKDPGGNWFQEWTNGKPIINDGPNGLQVLDHTVQQAEAAGIKFIMMLTNNWLDYGGMDTYTHNLLSDQESHTSFFTNPTVIDAFKTYIRAVVTRYASSPAILAWELANEARCQESNCNKGQVLTDWADQISSFIKTLDPNHLVTFGGYGYLSDGPCCDFQYDGDSGEDHSAILKLPSIDFGTVHHYTQDDTYPGLQYGMDWFKAHNQASVAANKPMIVEELGVNRGKLDISGDDIMRQYEEYLSDPGQAGAVQGVVLWSADVMGGECPMQGDPYAICTADGSYEGLVRDFGLKMAGKAGAGGPKMLSKRAQKALITYGEHLLLSLFGFMAWYVSNGHSRFLDCGAPILRRVATSID
ncbi:uncharacterized protein KY384_006848 [Bacidia gigantensis]|uniref:uncharacterized protein n=1 Tax=Bacidia gigantensis TaxID=2732470 RepID=UPI001D0533C4|nr:uncharacterized protein KY384_006848 [Bacidia gigantensis]KAG8527932.1 hypothetical protein KY384_006848 [Bacidia gigantensis]